MNYEELMKKKRACDNQLVAEMLGTTPSNISHILRRINSKRHKEALEALKKVIETREKLVKDFKKPE